MSKQANPTAIGLFMIGAAVLVVAGIVTFASTALFDERESFISYFEESVNGLEVGAPVKFKGVPVGRVTELRIRIDLDDRTFQVPVVYEIDLSSLTSETGQYVDLADAALLEAQVVDGLRAKLRMESFVTGQLYVELTYVADPGEPVVADNRSPYPAIPTAPSLLASIGDEAGSLVADLQMFDVGALNRNLMALLAGANRKLAALDVEGINASLVAASQAFEELAAAPEIRVAFREIPEMSAQLGQTLEETQRLVRSLEASIDPIQVQVGGASEEVALTMQALREAVQGTQQLLSTDAGIGYQLEEALSGMAEAAEALRMLARSLEQNPSALIRGKAQPDESP